jgi:hypothetical protein
MERQECDDDDDDNDDASLRLDCNVERKAEEESIFSLEWRGWLSFLQKQLWWIFGYGREREREMGVDGWSMMLRFLDEPFGRKQKISFDPKCQWSS